MILESLDGTFSGVATMHVSRGELVGNVLFFEVGLQDVRAFIVQSLDVGPGAPFYKKVVHFDICSENGGSLAVLDGFGGNEVAVVIVEDQQVVVALAGRQGKFSSEIAVAFSGGGPVNDSGKKVVGAFAFLEWSGKKIRVREKGESWLRRFGGALVLSGLLEVGFGCGNRVGSVFAERFRSETGENLELGGCVQGRLKS